MVQLTTSRAEPRVEVAINHVAPTMASAAPMPWVIELARMSPSLGYAITRLMIAAWTGKGSWCARRVPKWATASRLGI